MVKFSSEILAVNKIFFKEMCVLQLLNASVNLRIKYFTDSKAIN